MHHFAQSVLLKLGDQIAELLDRELQALVGCASDVQSLRDQLQGMVKVNRHEVELPVVPGNESVYRCAGYKLDVLPAHVQSCLDLHDECSARVTERICESLQSIQIGCPLINYAHGQLYLACDTAGSCVELARLAVALDRNFPATHQTLPLLAGDEWPWLMWDNGNLHMNHPFSARGLWKLQALAKSIREELRPGMYGYARAGGTR